MTGTLSVGEPGKSFSMSKSTLCDKTLIDIDSKKEAGQQEMRSELEQLVLVQCIRVTRGSL